jgi:type IV pilus biogenesis protein PilP
VAKVNGNASEDKIPDSVKDVVKHLDKTPDDVTLEDINSARQAIAKIDALIEIEKRLAELEKIRQQRGMGTSLSAAIPASALQPPPSFASTPATHSAKQMPAAEKSVEISRIVGREGHYSAVVKLSDNETKTVQAGDHLPDGSTVVSITTGGVQVEHNGVRHTVHLKNVGTVFGNSY